VADDNKSFQELLIGAPLAAKADTMTVIGVLARAPETENFVLTLADGSSVTLGTNAVKSLSMYRNCPAMAKQRRGRYV
jgi:hypothetical protein